jgi:lipoprotein-releasing system ATP-binding protein
MGDPSRTDSSGLRVRNLHKSFHLGASAVEVLKGVELDLADGEALVLTGPSGSGKSTLLHIVGTLDRPTGGTVEIDGCDPTRLAESQLARFRNRNIGFVFQDSHLLPQYSVLENVLMPTLASGKASEPGGEWARHLLDRVGLGDRLAHRPAQLSGGERQRATVARALVNRPHLLLCDEPTGSLDGATAETIAELLFELHRQELNMLLVVTHSQALAGRFPRRLELRDGKCVEV